jgi:16S rRNA processing protein RimM
LTLVTAGRVGRPHGRDGSFYVDGADHPLEEGTALLLTSRALTIERRAGTDERPLLRLSGLGDPDAIAKLRGELLLVEAELGEEEWLAADLIGCAVPGLGTVRRVLDAPSCDLLELDDGTLVPFVSDAIGCVDCGARRIEVRREFLE